MNTWSCQRIQVSRSPVSPSGMRFTALPSLSETVVKTSRASASGMLPHRWISRLPKSRIPVVQVSRSCGKRSIRARRRTGTGFVNLVALATKLRQPALTGWRPIACRGHRTYCSSPRISTAGTVSGSRDGASERPGSTGWRKRGTRFSAAITPNLVCQPARASILTGMLPLTHGAYDNFVDLDARIAESGWARRLSNAGYVSKFIGKGHFGEDPKATPFGAPESREQSAGFPENWSGPYMGFDDVELMILGHWHEFLPCEKPPRGSPFRALVLEPRPRGRSVVALAAGFRARAGSGADLVLEAPRTLAFHDLGDRPHPRLPGPMRPGEAVLPLGVLPGPASPVRLSRALEPASSRRGYRHLPDPHSGSRPPAMVAPGVARERAAGGEASAPGPCAANTAGSSRNPTVSSRR